MMTRKMNRFVQVTLLGSALLSALWLGGCKDRCDPVHDQFKCDGNQLMYCDFNSRKWFTEMDCGDYSARCTRTDVTFHKDAVVDTTHYPWGCAVPSITCDETEAGKQKCAANHSYIAMCSEDGGGNAVVILDNWDELPFCVEHSDGHAAFAWREGECLEGESICVDEEGYLECEDGVWADDQSLGTCFLEQNLVCEQEAEGDGFRTASCEFADPCSSETGEYDMCKSESLMFHCVKDESSGWFWMPATCSGGRKCIEISETQIVCQ